MRKITGILVMVTLFICGCGSKHKMSSPETSFEAFFNNEISAQREDGSEVWNKDLVYDDKDWNCYKVGELVDVDNDGEKEQHIDGPKGGFFLDYRDNQLYILPGDNELVGEMTYRQVDGKFWIIYMDATHSGREYYRLVRYAGIKIEEEFEIKKIEGETTEYFVNSELSTETAFNEIKFKYIK